MKNSEERKRRNRERMRQWRRAHGIPLRGSTDPAIRFWRKVDKRSDKECWPWMGARVGGSHPYGQFVARGEFIRAHRFAWNLYFGAIPEGVLVLHRCDNPPCVNPAHLFLGSDLDNAHDMYRKGRGRKSSGDAHWMRRFGGKFSGEKNPNAKLTNEQAADIRRLYDSGEETTYTLADMFGVSRRTISRIVNGLNY